MLRPETGLTLTDNAILAGLLVAMYCLVNVPFRTVYLKNACLTSLQKLHAVTVMLMQDMQGVDMSSIAT